MRGPIIGVAFFLGAAFVLAMGTLPACAITPSDTLDAGTDVYIPPVACDTIGYTCAQCQACAGTQATCGEQLTTCGELPDCVSLSESIDDTCDPDETTISDCVTTMCSNVSSDEDAITAYNLAAACVYGTACPQTCNLQHLYNNCAGF